MYPPKSRTAARGLGAQRRWASATVGRHQSASHRAAALCGIQAARTLLTGPQTAGSEQTGGPLERCGWPTLLRARGILAMLEDGGSQRARAASAAARSASGSSTARPSDPSEKTWSGRRVRVKVRARVRVRLRLRLRVRVRVRVRARVRVRVRVRRAHLELSLPAEGRRVVRGRAAIRMPHLHHASGVTVELRRGDHAATVQVELERSWLG